MRDQKVLFTTLLVLGSLAAGATTHFFIFGCSFFSSSFPWIAVFVRAALAFFAGFLWRRYSLGSLLLLSVIYLAIDCGPILMVLWALFNYTLTGKVGFNLAYWIIPAAVDFLALWIGARFTFKFPMQHF